MVPSFIVRCGWFLWNPTNKSFLLSRCHGRKYGPKGVGFGQGAGTLSMDTGAHFGNKEVEMTLVFCLLSQ